MIKRICEDCKKPFEYPAHKGGQNVRFCVECRNPSRATKRSRWAKANHCPDCGKLIANDSQYCHQCSYKYKGKSGNLNPNWKGGKYVQKNTGYAMIRMPEHPRAGMNGYVFEHIVAWEHHFGHPLPDGYVIHHLNGIRHDNRHQNLLALPRKGHSPALNVKEIQTRLRDVETQLLQHRLM